MYSLGADAWMQFFKVLSWSGWASSEASASQELVLWKSEVLIIQALKLFACSLAGIAILFEGIGLERNWLGLPRCCRSNANKRGFWKFDETGSGVLLRCYVLKAAIFSVGFDILYQHFWLITNHYISSALKKLAPRHGSFTFGRCSAIAFSRLSGMGQML